MLDVKEIQDRIERWLRGKGRYTEDLASEMFVYCFELQSKNPEINPNMRIVELKAYDRLYPRDRSAEGVVSRDAMQHTVDNVIQFENSTIERTEISETDFKQNYVAGNGRKSEKIRLKKKMTRSKYLARFRIGHLPFVY